MRALRLTLCSLVLPAFLLTGGGLAAQTRLAIVGGATISKLSGEGVFGDEDLESRTGINLGISAEVPLLGRFVRFVPGGVFIDKGFTFASGTSSLKMSYLEVVAPLMVSLPLGGALRFHVFGGPGFALEFGCQLKSTEGNVQSSFDCQNQDFDFKGTDVTVMAGAGVEVPVAPEVSILLNVALDSSLRSIDSSVANADVKHRAWLINAGVAFPLAQRR
jgi:hypothetical protein